MELNSNTFKKKCDSLFETTKNILSAMFIFGFIRQRKNAAGNRFLMGLIENPIKNDLKSQWDEDIWAKVARGSEYVVPTVEEEADPFPLFGILFVMRQLDKAIELNHPDWGVFYIIGEALGRFNSGEIHQSEFEYFISKLSLVFIKKHKDEILHLCNYFDEKDKKLNLFIERERIVAYFVDK